MDTQLTPFFLTQVIYFTHTYILEVHLSYSSHIINDRISAHMM
jgi:hypothetical protein